MPTLSSNYQTTFIENRSIIETFLLARECIHHWDKNKIPSAALKIDFNKTFDTVFRCFLYQLMRARDFLSYGSNGLRIFFSLLLLH
jgi:hypothetical protein